MRTSHKGHRFANLHTQLLADERGGFEVWEGNQTRKRTNLIGSSLVPVHWSGKRDSNPQPSAWEADALPLRHSRIYGRL